MAEVDAEQVKLTPDTVFKEPISEASDAEEVVSSVIPEPPSIVTSNALLKLPAELRVVMTKTDESVLRFTK